jgi:hypothetical protein
MINNERMALWFSPSLLEKPVCCFVATIATELDSGGDGRTYEPYVLGINDKIERAYVGSSM